MPAPLPSDELFVASDQSDDPDLNTYQFDEVEITIKTTRYVGEVDGDGYLMNLAGPDGLIERKMVPENLILLIQAGDVDRTINQVDVVYFNPDDFPDIIAHLQTTGPQEWAITTIQIPIERVRFPADPSDGGTVVPRENVIRIDIDALFNDTDPTRTGTNVDWVVLGFTQRVWRPTLLVHGWKSNSSVWGDYWNGALDGVDVASDSIDVGPFASFSFNATLLSYGIAEMRERYGVDKVTVVAHSKGGLDTRRYLQFGNRDVDRLIMIGTPNAGSNWAELTQAAFSTFGLQEGLDNANGHQLSTTYMNGVFNPGDYPSPGTQYIVYAGDHTNSGGTSPPFLKFVLGGLNDTVVPISSVWGLPPQYGDYIYYVRESNDGFSIHSPLLQDPDNDFPLSAFDELHPWILEPTPSWVAPAFPTHGLQAFAGNRSQQDLMFIANDGLGVTSWSAYPTQSRAAPVAFRLGPVDPPAEFGGQPVGGRAGLILQGEVKVDTLDIDSAPTAHFHVSWFEGELGFEVIDPAGVRHTPSSTDPDVEYFDASDGTISRTRSYTIQNPPAGEWTVETTGIIVPNPEGVFYWVGAILEGTPIELSAGTDAGFYRDGEPVVVVADLTESGAPILGADVAARLILPDTTLADIVLFDDGTNGDVTPGDGEYAASYVAPMPGYYSIVVTAERTTGTPFTRVATTGVSVASSASTLNGSFSDMGVDTNANGLYDWLDIEVTTSIDGTGDYVLRGDLEDSSGAIIEVVVVDTTLSGGIQTLTLSFEGQNIFEHGVAGPYILKRAVLAVREADGELLPVDIIEDAHTTAGYSHDDFERPVILPYGEPSEEGVDSDGSG